MAQAGAHTLVGLALAGINSARQRGDLFPERLSIEQIIRIAPVDATVDAVLPHDVRAVAIPGDAKVAEVFPDGEKVIGIVSGDGPQEIPTKVTVMVMPADATVGDVFPSDLSVLDVLPPDATISKVFREGSAIAAQYGGGQKIGDLFEGKRVVDLLEKDSKLGDVFDGRARVLDFVPAAATHRSRKFPELDTLKRLKTFQFER